MKTNQRIFARRMLVLAGLMVSAALAASWARALLEKNDAEFLKESIAAAQVQQPPAENEASASVLSSTATPDGNTSTSSAAVQQAIAKDGFWWNDAVLGRIGKQTQSVTVNGVTVTASGLHVEEGRAYVNLCVANLPGSERAFGAAPFALSGMQVDSYYGHISSQSAIESCMAYEYELPKGVNQDWREASVSLNSISFVPPMENRECETLSERAKASQRLSQLGVRVECKSVPGQAPQLTVSNRGSAASQSEAEQLVLNEVNGFVEGPWVFTFSR